MGITDKRLCVLFDYKRSADRFVKLAESLLTEYTNKELIKQIYYSGYRMKRVANYGLWNLKVKELRPIAYSCRGKAFWIVVLPDGETSNE